MIYTTSNDVAAGIKNLLSSFDLDSPAGPAVAGVELRLTPLANSWLLRDCTGIVPPVLDKTRSLAYRAIAALRVGMILDVEKTLCVETVHTLKPAKIFAGLVLPFAVSAYCFRVLLDRRKWRFPAS